MGSRANFRLDSECSQASICPSCNENTYSEINAPDLGPRRMTKYSLSESLIGNQFTELQKNYQDIVLSYHKLKISFTVMLILNAILLVVVITCMVFIIPHISTVQPEEKSNGIKHSTVSLQYQPPTRSYLADKQTPSPPSSSSDGDPTISCQSIQSKLGKLYMNGQKVENAHLQGKRCTTGDFMDSFMQYIKATASTDQKKAAYHITTTASDLSICRDSRRRKCLKNWKAQMNTTDLSINGESIFVPKKGNYFIYNRVTLEMDVANATSLGDITHSLRYSNSGSRFQDIESSKISCLVTNKKFSHISYIEKVHHLDKGAELKIAMITPSSRHVKFIRGSSAFGMFEL